MKNYVRELKKITSILLKKKLKKLKMEEKIGKNISYSDGIKVMVKIQPQVKRIA